MQRLDRGKDCANNLPDTQQVTRYLQSTLRTRTRVVATRRRRVVRAVRARRRWRLIFPRTILPPHALRLARPSPNAIFAPRQPSRDLFTAHKVPVLRPGAVGFNGVRRIPTVVNEPVRSYAPGSPERASLKRRLESMSAERVEIPVIIGGKEFRTGDIGHAVMPHKHAHILADYHKANPAQVDLAIKAAVDAQRQ
ncbi:MAG: hypothetical protein J0626_04105, partial [Rhodospirillaceae bacterium]|nr:hypothetical protein [Rhodospirillaceae bacterium]